jgi:cobalt-precorrin-5B (C1)-methyltransferase
LASKSRKLKTGYTTGACAAAAAKAAVLSYLGQNVSSNDMVEIPFPDGTRHSLRIAWLSYGGFPDGVFAAVIKDGGDDPDITNGIEIQTKVVFHGMGLDPTIGPDRLPPIVINGGKGVGRVTKPGLAVPVGQAAINPGPQGMIRHAIRETMITSQSNLKQWPKEIEVTIWVPDGEAVAKKTLNSRLGIIGGISILGTTGIVKPLSAEAWTATITASMSVAKAVGLGQIVLSTGRSSEKAHMTAFALSEEAYIMMGDYVAYALTEAKKFGFSRITLVAQWAKMLKIAMAIPQTHVRHGAIDLQRAVSFLGELGCTDLATKQFNTAREIFDTIQTYEPDIYLSLLKQVCSKSRHYGESFTSGIPVTTYLVSFSGEVIAHDG